MEKYELIRHIGRPRQGNCAALMLAQERDSSKIYAVKVVSLSQLGIEGYSRGTLESALKEVEMFSDLSHPFIVNCRRTFVEGGQLYIVLDYADGGDLHGRIVRMRAKHSLFDESTILRWFVQLCLAVNFLHEKNIVHRDIQSRNVFLDGHDPGSVKLGDIAIPRVLQNRQDLASTSVATSGYVSPGTCEERPYSFKSDVWSLGCILYELACLEHPFDGASVQAAVGSIGKRQFNSVNPKYSEATAKLIEEMLSDDPGKRPTTAQILSRPHLQSHLQLILREKKLITAPPAPESSERDRIRQIQNELLGFHGTLHVLKSQGPSCRHLEAEEADAVPSPLSSIPPLQFTGSDMPLTQATQTCDSPGDEQSGKIEWNLQQETPTNVADSFSVPVHNGVPRSDGTRNAAEDVKRESSKQKEQSLRHHEEELSNIRQQYQRDRWRLAEKHRQRIERSYEYNADTNEPDKAKQVCQSFITPKVPRR
ncbi:NEK kinase [Toxoplasma gondii ARI]|uniref:non-specific serine/threonine protein kinase n=1 Tax=Toxoplasma gondii ARI TaxID=1074872 RepID=A0A139XLT9_TOXGO|nr:NEK kinase [Toxoplasma gondii ARI]